MASDQLAIFDSQEIEVQLTRTEASYLDRVNAILRGWDSLAAAVLLSDSKVYSFAEFLHGWTLKLVLQGEWPGLQRIVKTRLSASLQKCLQVPQFADLISPLLPLVNDPWESPHLSVILNSETITEQQGLAYLQAENCQIIKARINCLLEGRIEQIAYKLLQVCHKHIKTEDSVVKCTEDDRHFFLDLYYVLLYKFERNSFLNSIKSMPEEEGVAFVQRLLLQTDSSRVWKHRLKIADLCSKILVATTIVKEYSDTFWFVFSEWCSVQLSLNVDSVMMEEMIRKYISLAHSQVHLYTMSSVLHFKCGLRLHSLVTELCIRGLTLDLNDIERVKLKEKEEDTKVQIMAIEQRMSVGFTELASIFESNPLVARECLLTAFSLHPTPEKLARLNELGMLELTSSPSKVIVSGPVHCHTSPEKVVKPAEKKLDMQATRSLFTDQHGNEATAVDTLQEEAHVAQLKVAEVPELDTNETECKIENAQTVVDEMDTSDKVLNENPSCKPTEGCTGDVQPTLPVTLRETSMAQNACPYQTEKCFAEGNDDNVELSECNLSNSNNSVINIKVDTGQPPTNSEPSIEDNFDTENITTIQEKFSEEDAVPTAKGAVSTAEGAYPVAEGAVPTAEGAYPVAEGAVPTAEGAVPTAEGAVPTAEGAVPTAEGAVPTAEGAVPTAEGAVPTAEGAVPTAEGAVPTAESTVPTAEGAVPTAEGAVPTAEGAVPTAEGAVPTAEGAVPTAEGAVVTAEGAVPTAEGTVPTAEGAVPTATAEFAVPIKKDFSQESASCGGESSSKNPENVVEEKVTVENDITSRDQITVIDETNVDADKTSVCDEAQFDEINSSKEAPVASRNAIENKSFAEELVIAEEKSANSSVNSGREAPDSDCSPCNYNSFIPATSTLGDQHHDILTNPAEVLDGDKLNLPKHLCDDLAVVLSSPRWQGLSWGFGWKHLAPMCERYMEDSHAFKNLTKELKYLELDYSQFSHLPSAEAEGFTGIEKGYEMYVEEPGDDMEAYEYIQTNDQGVTSIKSPIKRGRGRPQLKPIYFDSDSDYDSSGFQKMKNSDSDESPTAYKIPKPRGRPKSIFLDDGKEPKKRKSISPTSKIKKRMKFESIDSAIKAVIARVHEEEKIDISSTTEETTEESDTLPEENSSSSEDVKPKIEKVEEVEDSKDDIMIIATKPAKVQSTKVASSMRMQLKKQFQLNTLRYYRKQNVNGSVSTIPYTFPRAVNPGGPRQFLRMGHRPVQQRPRIGQPHTFFCNRPRATQLISPLPRIPLIKSSEKKPSNIVKTEVKVEPTLDTQTTIREEIVKKEIISSPPFSEVSPSQHLDSSKTSPIDTIKINRNSQSLPYTPVTTTVTTSKPNPKVHNYTNYVQQQLAKWQYSGCLYNPPRTIPSSIQCTYKTRDGRIIPLLSPGAINSPTATRDTASSRDRLHNVNSSYTNGNSRTAKVKGKSTYTSQITCEALSKYLANQEENKLFFSSKSTQLKNSSVTITRKKLPLSTPLDKRKKDFEHNDLGRTPLASAQKNVLNRIMSHGNGMSDISPSVRPPIRAMPVTHTTPNIVMDKTGMSRVLPKGTTVVRKNRPSESSQAGPSGIDNGGVIRPRVSPNPTRSQTAFVKYSNSTVVNSKSGLSAQAVGRTITSSQLSMDSSSYVINSSSGNQPRLLTHDVSRDGIILSSGIGNQVFTHSNNREVYLSQDSANNGNSSASGSVIQTPTIASLLNSSSPDSQSNNSTTQAPLGYATLVGGALNVNSTTLGGALGGDPSVSTTSTVAINPRVNIFKQVDGGSIQGSTLVTSTSTGGRLGNIISGGGLLGRVLAASGVSGVRLLGGTNANTIIESSTNSVQTTKSASMLESLLRDSPVKRSTAPYSSVVVNVCTAPTNNSITPSTSPLELYRDNDSTETITLNSGSSLNPLASSSSHPASPVGSCISPEIPVNVSGGDNSPFHSSQSTLSGTGGAVVINSGNSNVPGNVLVASNNSSSGLLLSPTGGGGEQSAPGMQQVLVPAQLVQVHTSDGSTGLGLVHSASLDIRLPAGTRVIKSGGGGALSSSALTTTTNSTALTNAARQVSLLQNVKILQNRQIVRTVVMPNSMALQGLGGNQPGTQLVALSGSSSDGQQMKLATSPKVSNRGIAPCGLVIRTVRPQLQQNNLHQITLDNQTLTEGERQVRLRAPTDEGLAERLNRQYLKSQLSIVSTVQSVGTQTQTTAVKNTAGQLVSRVVMNNLTGTATVSSLPTTAVLSVASSNTSQNNPTMSPLPLSATNAVSSETLEQLREFESVFEKVSNKSTKDEDEVVPKTESFPVTMSSIATTSSNDESIIAAQLLSLANDSPARTTHSYVYSLPAGSSSSGTFITIPNSSQPSTLILVNPAVSTQQPPPPASPALSTTSSHSSIASSPSSTPSKKKPVATKPKVVVSQNAACVGSPMSSSSVNPKTPPPPKAPPKPQVAKPQVEDNDEIRAKIKVILDNYKLLLAETPQQQPAPRNRKNCPPSRNDSKSSNKKKSSTGKKIDGSSTSSPMGSDPGTSASTSPVTPATPTPTNAMNDGNCSVDAPSGSSNISLQSHDATFSDEKCSRSEGIPPNVVVSNLKAETASVISSTSGASLTGLPQSISTGGRIVQFIRTGNKVTAITTRQPLYKTKPGNSSGPPPNVTIQGRINMSDLVDTQLASILSANPQATLITKKVEGSGAGIQQVVLQSGQLIPANQITGMTGQQTLNSGGNATQVIQTLQSGQQVVHSGSVVQIPSGQSVIQTASGQLLHIGTSNSILHSGASVASSSNVTVQAMLQGGAIVQSRAANMEQVLQGGQQVVVHHQQQSDVVKQSENTSGEESNGSEQSDSMTLPPFFTLSKSFIVDDKKDCESADVVPHKHHTRVATSCNSSVRTSSLESLKSDISCEEVPPSPATLNKQLQSAFMSESALSPSVHQSPVIALPSSTSTSPAPSDQNLSYAPLSPQALYSHSGVPVSMRSTGVLMSQSPSGADLYLDGPSGPLTGLDAMPLVVGSGVDGRSVHSPAFSDLVNAGTLLPWSPRSGDSIMAQSPTIQDALTGSMGLDVTHPTDTLCDTSTPFPGLFSIEGDASSVSSNASDDLAFSSRHHVPTPSSLIENHSENSVLNHSENSVLNHNENSVLKLEESPLLGSSKAEDITGSKVTATSSEEKEAPWRFDDSLHLIEKERINDNSLNEMKDEELLTEDDERKTYRNRMADSVLKFPQQNQPKEESLAEEDNKNLLQDETNYSNLISEDIDSNFKLEPSEEKKSQVKKKVVLKKRKSDQLEEEDCSLKRVKEECSVLTRHASAPSEVPVTVVDVLIAGGVKRRRPGVGSRESSRGCSPAPLVPSTDVSSSTAGGMVTRRTSNRDHSKKQRCSCCADTKHSCCSVSSTPHKSVITSPSSAKTTTAAVNSPSPVSKSPVATALSNRKSSFRRTSARAIKTPSESANQLTK